VGYSECDKPERVFQQIKCIELPRKYFFQPALY